MTTKNAQFRRLFRDSVEIAGQYIDKLLRAFVIVIADSNLGHGLQTYDLKEQTTNQQGSDKFRNQNSYVQSPALDGSGRYWPSIGRVYLSRFDSPPYPDSVRRISEEDIKRAIKVISEEFFDQGNSNDWI